MNCRSWLWKRNGFLMPPNSLKNFEIQKYYQDEPRFNGVYYRNNFPAKIKDRANVINLVEYADVGTHWIALFCRRNRKLKQFILPFNVEHVLMKLKNFLGIKT